MKKQTFLRLYAVLLLLLINTAIGAVVVHYYTIDYSPSMVQILVLVFMWALGTFAGITMYQWSTIKYMTSYTIKPIDMPKPTIKSNPKDCKHTDAFPAKIKIAEYVEAYNTRPPYAQGWYCSTCNLFYTNNPKSKSNES